MQSSVIKGVDLLPQSSQTRVFFDGIDGIDGLDVVMLFIFSQTNGPTLSRIQSAREDAGGTRIFVQYQHDGLYSSVFEALRKIAAAQREI